MKRILLMIAAVVLTGMLLLGTPALAHHMPNTNEKFTSQSGDPAYFDDAGECMDLVSGDQHCVVLYGHIFDLLNPVPINIQRPSPDCETMARGFTSTPPVEPYWSFNRQDLYSSAGFVEYSAGDCEDPRIHPERGLSSDINVAQDVPIKGYWYMSADDGEFNAVGLGTDAQSSMGGVMPCITVRMELWTERFVGTGDPLAIGQTTKSLVSTPYGSGQEAETPVPQLPCPDGEMPEGTMNAEEVTEFEIDLGGIEREIRQHEGFVVGIQWWLHNMGDDDWSNDKVYHRNWNLHTGPDYPNRLVLAVEDSVRVERVQPQLFDGKIYIHSVLNSPWGSYDVDTANILVQLFDGDGNEVDLQHLEEPILRYSVDHDGHFKPVNATFPWDFSQEDLPPGEYSIRVTATNWQHTADAFRERTFNIREDMTVDPGDEDWEGFDRNDDIEESPALTTAGLLVGALLLVGIVSTRRRR